MLYTATRLLPMTCGLISWLWLGDGSVSDPANWLLLFSGATGVLGISAVRRYWYIRNTSRSRRDSSLLA